ncbi:hypothetical protein [Amycolatopsis sp. H20-H5]|uniref:hypothetical protein n=1 Tax=Amycolatopsis sp. H20-H5 TaxID=3046309 RepID=UPI002DBA1A5D|nr:hypothetical protein [Amycolatopsis sp. H20-H5]MEC3974748.1 hypothetical protein [Amycolatopsis sp. H20-H5]
MIEARCYDRACGGTWPRKPCRSHTFSVTEVVRLLEWMGEEDWEDGPRCLRRLLGSGDTATQIEPGRYVGLPTTSVDVGWPY